MSIKYHSEWSLKALSIILIFIITGCVSNKAFRTEVDLCNSGKCENAVIETNAQYDLAFVEFTERGNVFDREKMEQVVRHVKKKKEENKGASVVVFVHGWKNNAEGTNGNIDGFRKLLETAAKFQSPRNTIGIFIGWRGKTIDIPLIEDFTYWDRKTTAEQIGRGGVSELLLRLEHLLKDGEKDPNKNIFVVTGHSFGGAVVLSALKPIMLERVISAESDENGCYKTRPFGHGVILLNPAIEANAMLSLKETVALMKCFHPAQTRLVHVISSEDDLATNWAFPFGQRFGTSLFWSQKNFVREFKEIDPKSSGMMLDDKSRRVNFSEYKLDITTVGNFPEFRTGKFNFKDGEYKSCTKGKNNCLENNSGSDHIPVKGREPLAFIYTDGDFIHGHSHIFTLNVLAYITTIVMEASVKNMLSTSLNDSTTNIAPSYCFDEEQQFDFSRCFLEVKEKYEKLETVNTHKS